ncbi:MAG: ATP synthase F0 subunit B [Myxococcota bacterium]
MTNRYNKQVRRILFTLGVTLLWLCVFAAPALAAGGGGEEGHHGVDWKHFAGSVVNFMIFCGIIVYMAKDSVRNFFESRRDTLAADMQEAERLKAEAEAKLAEYTEKLDQLTTEREAILEEYNVQGEREKERLIEDAKRQVTKMRQDAELMIRQELKSAIARIEEKAVDEAVHLAREMAREKLAKQTLQKKLVDDYLSDMDGMEDMEGVRRS